MEHHLIVGGKLLQLSWYWKPGLENGTHGQLCREQRGRFSSAIVAFDSANAIAEPRSGRVYRLAGHPGNDRDAAYVLAHWLRHQPGCRSS
jgi:hypothetical protein